MRAFLKICLTASRHCVLSVCTLVLWTFWLGLGLLLGLQIYIARVHELEVPSYILRAVEQRYLSAGLHTTFGRTRFDPSGHLLIEDLRATVPSFEEPIVTVRTLSARLNPWTLLVGRVDELEVSATGVTLFVPAMLSASGRVEELVRNLDVTFAPHGEQLTLLNLAGMIGSLPISAHGTVQLAPHRAGQPSPPPVAEFLAQNYAALSRRIATALVRLNSFESPHVHLELTPAKNRGAIADVVLTASGFHWSNPAIQTGPLLVTTQVTLPSEAPTPIDLAIDLDRFSVPGNGAGERLHAQINGTLRAASGAFDPITADLTAAEFRIAGARLSSTALHLTPGPLPRLAVNLTTRFAGQPLCATVTADLEAQAAQVAFSGFVDNGLLGVIGQQIGQDVRAWIDFPEPASVLAADASFAAGWKWEKLNARIVVPAINAFHVPLTDGRVAVELTPTRLYAPEAFARIGENFARGTYDHDPATNRYRFLLDGELRPLAISGWFNGSWWPNFFNNLVFPAATPSASVEVAGRWGRNTAGESRVLVIAASPALEIYGAKFEDARARLFIRPNFLDVYEFSGAAGPGRVSGKFNRRLDATTQTLNSAEFDVVSNIDPAGPARMFGNAGRELVEPFAFDQPPALTIRGRIDGAAAPGGAHTSVDVDARSNGAFRFHDFPLEYAALQVVLRDDVLALESVEAGFAGGTVTGRTKVWGRGGDRRLGFDYALKGAGLGRAIATLENFAAQRKKAPMPPPNRFLNDKANLRFELAASAEGKYDDPFSYRGEGNASLSGAELGEVKLLGLLSDLFSFTALRFNMARATFRIDGTQLVFSDVSLTGANSAINAHGTYALDRRALDFNAKIFPFQESDPGLKTLVGAVLSPLSNVFEVKLGGSLDQPSWRFAIGPSNLLRNPNEGAPAPDLPLPPVKPAPSP